MSLFHRRAAGTLVLLMGLVVSTEAVPAQEIPAALVHWVFSAEHVRDGALRPVTGEAALAWPPELEFAADETPAALRLKGSQSLAVPPELRAVLLPRESLTVDAWVRIDRELEWGGIWSVLQDNGGFEKGWLFGFRGTRFTLGLSTTGGDDGDGHLTYLSSNRFLRLGAWHHVAATYDGKTATVYVDGHPAGDTQAQSGPILYPASFPFVIGAYQDDNEQYPITGRLHSLRLWHQALPARAIEALYQAEHGAFAEATTFAVVPRSDAFVERVRMSVEGDALEEQASSVVATTKQLLRPAGRSLAYPARPVDAVLSPDGSWLYAKDNRGLAVVDAHSWQLVQHLPFPSGGASMHGLLVAPDGSRIWVTTAQSALYEAEVDARGRVEWTRALSVPGPGGRGDSHACGMALSADGERLFVCLSRNNSLAEIELESGKVLREIPVSVAPYDVVLVDGGRHAVVSNWGGRRPTDGDLTANSSGTPVVVDTRGVASSGTVGWVNLETGRQERELATGLHPCDICLHSPSRRIYVANANSDTVTVIDAERFIEIETITVRPDPSLPYGSATNALAVTDDGRWLIAANGGNNALALIELASEGPSRVAGFLPTAWYPGAVVVREQAIYVANVKGFGSRAGEDAERRRVQSHLGVLSKVPFPSTSQLSEGTRDVRRAARVPQMLRAFERSQSAAAPRPVPERLGDPSTIEHVFYVIKENRTYDQIFGDLPQGRGDPKLCIYGRKVTPNHHAIAENFVLLDNYYCNGVNSADGHSWSTEGNVTDHLEKSFGGFTRSYTFGDDPLTYSSTGFIWDNVLLHGLTFRNYGEMDYAKPVPASASFSDIYRDFVEGTGRIRFQQSIGIEPLRRYSSPTYPGWNMKIPDVLRIEAFLKEFRQAEESGVWPNFVIVFLPQDHTSGLSQGMPTPAAHMADNDRALGKLVEAVSHSRFWPKSCIFVIEDDPQDGFDHVDGHRSICLVASPFARRGAVVGEFYNQTSVLHTMERMLGIPPMNQMDALSPLMSTCFTDTPDLTPYNALPANVPLDQLTDARKTPELNEWIAASAKQDFQGYDRADENTLNRVLWHAARGPDVPYPAEWAGAHGRGLRGRKLLLVASDDEDDDKKRERDP